MLYKLAGFIEDPKQSKNIKAGLFRRNGDSKKTDKSDDWTNFVYRKRWFYQDYFTMLDPDGDGEITYDQIKGFFKFETYLFQRKVRHRGPKIIFSQSIKLI